MIKRKWLVIPAVLAFTLFGAVYTMDTWFPFLQDLKPKAEIVIDKGTRKEVIETLIAKLKTHYVFPDKAKRAEATLLKNLRQNKYEKITDGDEFADVLTQDLYQITRDRHMAVMASPKKVPYDQMVAPPPASKEEWDQRTPLARRLLLDIGLALGKVGSAKVEHLTPNIGYLKLTDFPPRFVMEKRYATAMNELADTDGLVEDLRENRGGGQETVVLLISYFVDEHTRANDIWDRTTGITTQQWTADQLPGKRYGGKKPMVVLVGPGTKSAGEDFAYTMQAMKRATVLGEPTWGGANPSRPYRVSDYFAAWIASRRTISPITQTNWEGTGVIPDIRAAQEKSLEMAMALLKHRLSAK